jgi:predicted HAD superfamily Cof-like phosphohydrolase
MKEYFSKINEFNKAFNVECSNTPGLIDDFILRFNLMKEENEEYLESCIQNDLVEVLDACVDQMYILLGTIKKHGLEDVFEGAFNEVHLSNMSKLENGKAVVREDGKIIKGKDYFKPNLAKFLK